MRLVLFQPEIAQNAGAATRAAACFDAGLDIIEPCGFPLDARAMKRVAMDYGSLTPLRIHFGWTAFQRSEERKAGRLILLTTRADDDIWSFRFRSSDLVMLGQESAGAPDEVHEAADARLVIPIAKEARSLNMAAAAAVALAEMRRQIGWQVEIE